MKFSEDSPTNLYRLSGYGSGWIQVNEQRIKRGVIINTDTLINDWEPVTYKDLRAEHLQTVFELQPALILIGTGPRLRPPEPEIQQALVDHRAGFEYMAIDAACRTYNVLLSEARPITAILFPE